MPAPVSHDDILKAVDGVKAEVAELRKDVMHVRVVVWGDGGETRSHRDRIRDLEARGGLKGTAITAAGYVLAAILGLGSALVYTGRAPPPRLPTAGGSP